MGIAGPRLSFTRNAASAKSTGCVPHAGSPAEEHVPAEWRDKILHARLLVGDQVLMASDAPPDHQTTPQGFSISLQVKTPAEAERLFEALSEGGTVKMPIQKTFWSEAFGMLVDQFNIPWMVNCIAAG
jgi:PhnB protein